jgi:hypothetical protein
MWGEVHFFAKAKKFWASVGPDSADHYRYFFAEEIDTPVAVSGAPHAPFLLQSRSLTATAARRADRPPKRKINDMAEFALLSVQFFGK